MADEGKDKTEEKKAEAPPEEGEKKEEGERKEEGEKEKGEEKEGDEESGKGGGTKKVLGIPIHTHSMGVKVWAPPKALPAPSARKEKMDAGPPPNIVWQHIQARSWEELSADLDEEGAAEMVKTWYGDYLPLHAVCKEGQKVPDEVVAKVADGYPEAAKIRGKNRMLPLQLAVYHKGSYETVGKLIRMYPEALDAKVNDNQALKPDTTRTWVDLQGHSASVKKLIQRSTADWKVILAYEEEQRDQHDKLASLEKKMKTAKKKMDATDRANKSLADRVEALEQTQENMRQFVNDLIESKRSELDGSLNEIKNMIDEFTAAQGARNKETQDAIDAATRREVDGKTVFSVYTEDMMMLYQQNSKETEEIKKGIAELKDSLKGASK